MRHCSPSSRVDAEPAIAATQLPASFVGERHLQPARLGGPASCTQRRSLRENSDAFPRSCVNFVKDTQALSQSNKREATGVPLVFWLLAPGAIWPQMHHRHLSGSGLGPPGVPALASLQHSPCPSHSWASPLLPPSTSCPLSIIQLMLSEPLPWAAYCAHQMPETQQ